MESSICTVFTYSDFFLVFKLYNSGLQIMTLISDYLRFMVSVDIGGLSSEILRRVSFNS